MEIALSEGAVCGNMVLQVNVHRGLVVLYCPTHIWYQAAQRD